MTNPPAEGAAGPGASPQAAYHEPPPPSLAESLDRAARLVGSGSAPEAVPILTDLQRLVASASLFSPNESIDDVPTSSIPLLSVEFHLASATLQMPTSGAAERMANVARSLELFHAYLRRLEDADVLGPDLVGDYHRLLDDDEDRNGDGGGGDGNVGSNRRPASASSASRTREAKIARFRARRDAEEEAARLSALRERRARLGLGDGEELDGRDGDGAERGAALADLRRWAAEALDEVDGGAREMEMLEVAVRMERMRGEEGRRRGAGGEARAQAQVQATRGGRGRGPPPPSSGRGLQVTRITHDPVSGQLQCKREEIKSQVFRPGWNQPTMTLAEYGDREVARAIEREEKQKQAEAENKLQPRRYEQLLRDGMEDNADLVDKSAKLDREWDDWKDENPKGSGNKMGDRGDRNF